MMAAIARVEIVALDIFDNLAHQTMAFTVELFSELLRTLLARGLIECVFASLTDQVVDLTPQAIEELIHARKAILVPELFLIGRAHEQHSPRAPHRRRRPRSSLRAKPRYPSICS